MITKDEEIHALTETLIYELVKAFALPHSELAEGPIRLIFGKAARATAKVGIGLDCAVAEGGIPAGARWLLPRFVKSHSACGVENIPASGPLVIASNHPASIDSIVISAHVNRPDYKVIIGDIPFFEYLPHVSQQAIFAPDTNNTAGRMQVMRESIRHLRGGRALLIFPRGEIEPDPAFMPHPDAEFDHWSRSLEIFMQRVPGLQILITIASGVISPSAMRHPITWFRRNRPDRQRLAFMYQLARQMLSGKEIFGLTPRITFGEIVAGASHEHMLAEIKQAALRTLYQHMEWVHV
jgi:1-acyl-sn-glycerol-3-phosphate acyltransferase